MPPAPKLIAALVLTAGLGPFGHVAIAAATGSGPASASASASASKVSAPVTDPDGLVAAPPVSEPAAGDAAPGAPPAVAGTAVAREDDAAGDDAATGPVPGEGGAGTTGPATPPAPTPTATSTTAGAAAAARPRSAMPEGGGFDVSAEDAFLAATNDSRAAAGAASLTWDHELTAYARRHARFLATDGNLQHSDITVLLDAWSTVGENVGVGPSVSAIHEALLASPEHYRNLADPRFRHVGVAVHVDAGGRIRTVHVFGA